MGPRPSRPSPRAWCWPLFSISSTRRNLVLSLLPVVCWVSCTLMMSRPTCTVWHLMPWLPFRQCPWPRVPWWPGYHQIDCGSIHLRPNTSGWAHASNLLSWILLLWLSVFLSYCSKLGTHTGLSLLHLPLLLTLTAYAATATTSCVSYMSSLALTSTATATLVRSFVTSRLDYCSTLYVGLPALHLRCLQQVIRTATCLIGGIPRTGNCLHA